MKIFFLIMIAMIGVITASANPADTVRLKPGQQKTAARGELRIKFISVVEDSRCPVGVNCIWAGNAQIKVKLTDSRGLSKTVMINTNTGNKGDQYGGYAVNLVSLTPLPREGRQTAASRYTATFSVARLYR